jgi:hypothetical protein
VQNQNTNEQMIQMWAAQGFVLLGFATIFGKMEIFWALCRYEVAIGS